MWNYYKVQPSNPLSSNSETFNYKTSITGNAYNLVDSEAGYDATQVGKNETEIAFSLKHLNNFWRTLSLELSLIWFKSCVLADMTVRLAGNNNKPPAIVSAGRLEFQIIDTRLFVPVVTLSTENGKKLLEQLKSGFKITVKWNKYRPQMTIQSNNNNLNYLTDPTFTKVNRLFVLSFTRHAEGDHISHYYVPDI